MSFFKPIHHMFGPHVNAAYAFRSFCLLFAPWAWKNGRSTAKLTKELSQHLHGDAFLFASGRTALLALLKALPLHTGEEIIVPAYTCVVVPNAIHAAGGTTVYCDIEKETLNFDMEELKKKVTPRTRAILCQHTFGIPANMPALSLFAKEQGLILIEDCAHILPDDTGPHDIGTSDYRILSFGRDKAISGVAGGAVVSKNREVSGRIQTIHEKSESLSLFSIKRFLLYPIFYFKARPFYALGLGKLSLALAAKLKLLPKIVDEEEKKGFQKVKMERMPNACANLALTQLKKLRSINDHRRMLTKFYRVEAKKRGWHVLSSITEEFPLQKFPLFFPHAEELRQKLRPRNIHLNDGWTRCTVCPEQVAGSAVGYEQGCGLHAEQMSEEIFSLPTHPTMTLSQARTLLTEIDSALTQQ